jgi:hypothetical protein
MGVGVDHGGVGFFWAELQILRFAQDDISLVVGPSPCEGRLELLNRRSLRYAGSPCGEPASVGMTNFKLVGMTFLWLLVLRFAKDGLNY